MTFCRQDPRCHDLTPRDLSNARRVSHHVISQKGRREFFLTVERSEKTHKEFDEHNRGKRGSLLQPGEDLSFVLLLFFLFFLIVIAG